MLQLLSFFFERCLPKAMRFVIISTQILVTILIFSSVICRSIFDFDLYGYEDFVLIAAFWLYMIGGAYGSYEGSHITADILTEVVKRPKLKHVLVVSGSVLEIIISLIITVWGWQLVLWGIEKGARSIAWKIPSLVPQSAIFVGFAIMFLYSIRNIWRLVTNRPVASAGLDANIACGPDKE
ncbi:TRAP transporter small permease subunit [Deltaproteobacteria bacterium OttesenSCG-928-M10]|nr:TRAP transporter small permease subunit [Deltaproteobacteria bacterium OttesenSCG-928-M10]